MSIAAACLVVLAAFIHATWNLMSKRAAPAGPTFVFAYTLAACIAYAPWTAWVLINAPVTWSAAVLACLAGSGVIHLAYSLCLQRGYQVADLSVVYPVARGTGPLLSSIGAFLLLGEPPTLFGLGGLMCVVAGIGLVSTQGNLSAFTKPAGRAGIRWGVATGILIASYTVVDAYGVKVLLIAPVVLDWFGNLLRPVLLAPVVLRNIPRAREAMRGRWWLAIGVGLLSPLSYILVLLAMDIGTSASVVAPAREMSMMAGALLGLIILKEPVGIWRILGCAVMAGGVVLLGLS